MTVENVLLGMEKKLNLDYFISTAMHKKINLPTKICPICQRSFAWRKKWSKIWDEIKYCSKKCYLKRIVIQREINCQVMK